MSTYIHPTVGRVVWFYPGLFAATLGMIIWDPQAPCKADVAFVHDNGRVNLSITDQAGRAGFAVQDVLLVQDGDLTPDQTKPGADVCYCTWMPFQLRQARLATRVESVPLSGGLQVSTAAVGQLSAASQLQPGEEILPVGEALAAQPVAVVV